MANFKSIEVLFGTPNPESQKVLVAPGAGVQAIFLQGSAAQFMTGFDSKKVKKNSTPPPAGVTFVGAAGGPGDVCYLVNGVLHCWNPD